MDEMIFVPHAPLFVAAANASAAAAAGVQGHVSRKAATAREGVCGEEEPGNDPREQDGNAC